METITECQPQSNGKDQWFRIVEGDICEAESDLVVISSAPARWEPIGAASDALRRSWGENVFDSQKAFLTFSPNSFFEIPGDQYTGGHAGISVGAATAHSGRAVELMVVRVPGAVCIADPIESMTTVIFPAVFAAVSALSEVRGRLISAISLTDLAGTRGFGIQQRLEAFLKAVSHWFSSPSAGDRVDLVLFNDGTSAYQELKAEWVKAMQIHFGWSVSTARDTLNKEEVGIVRDLLQRQMLGPDKSSPMHRALGDLYRRLDPESPRSVQEIAQAGRGLAEALSAELCEIHQLRGSANTFANLSQLEKQQGVAPWILSYLHTMRTLGNEASHVVQEGKSRRPDVLDHDDLLVLLANIRRVLDFRKKWVAQLSV